MEHPKKRNNAFPILVGRVCPAPKTAKIGRNKIVKVAPGRSFERLVGRYPAEPTPPEKPVEQQIEAIRTKERSFTSGGERYRSGVKAKVTVSNADTEGVKQRKEIDELQNSFDIAHDPPLAAHAHDEEKAMLPGRPGIARPGTPTDEEPSGNPTLAVVGDALGKNFTVFDTIRYRKVPHWMRSKSKWKTFCEKLAIRKATYRQNIILLKLSFERVGHTNEEIFKLFWDSQGRVTELDDDGMLIVPDWPFKSLRLMVRRRAALLKLGNKMFSAEPIERARQRKPYRGLLCDRHSERRINGEAVPIKVVEYLGNNEYVLKCGCRRTVTDYTAPDKSGKRKPITVEKEAKNVDIVESIRIFSAQQNQELSDDKRDKAA